jgi:hypothetical protein
MASGLVPDQTLPRMSQRPGKVPIFGHHSRINVPMNAQTPPQWHVRALADFRRVEGHG